MYINSSIKLLKLWNVWNLQKSTEINISTNSHLTITQYFQILTFCHIFSFLLMKSHISEKFNTPGYTSVIPSPLSPMIKQILLNLMFKAPMKELYEQRESYSCCHQVYKLINLWVEQEKKNNIFKIDINILLDYTFLRLYSHWFSEQ